MMKQIISFTLLLFIATSTIIITQPAKNNFQNSQIQYWYANFGEIHYNKPASYQLIVLNQGFCNSTEYGKLEHFNEPTFVVINGDLGSCSFPSRALVAQNLGASGVIFSSNQIKYAIGNVVIEDDGQGRNVKINSLFIQPKSYQNLKPLKSIMIKVDFPIVQRQVSDVTLFLTASERKNYVFLRNFRKYLPDFNNYINFNAVYYTISCEYCSPDDCILQNTCCTFDLENFKVGVGKYILKEQFRQSNILKYAKKIGNLDLWFDYMNRFDQECDINWINSEQCSKEIQKKLKITDNIDLTDEYHEMNEWRLQQTKMGVFSHPDLAVNGIRHSQTLTALSAISMICESLINQPGACTGNTSSGGSKTGLIVGLVILGIFLIILGICCYKKLIKKQITNDMSARVSELVAKYAAKVSDQKKKRKQKLMQKITEQI